MKILFFGDVFGKPGRQAVAGTLPKWKQEHKPDIIIANAENSAHGSGATKGTLDELRAAGVEAFTFGDHARFTEWEELSEYPIVRPANLAEATHGVGIRLIETATHERLLLLNLIGNAFMRPEVYDFFEEADNLLKQHAGDKPDAIFVDFHAEATSEAVTLGDYMDGRVSAFVGTHTHVPTADTRLLLKGTAFQSDVGMCGALNSSLGVSYESVRSWLKAELSGGPRKVPKKNAEDEPYICDAVLIETDGPQKSRSITRLTTRPQN